MSVGVDTPKPATADAVARFCASTPTWPNGIDPTPVAGMNNQ
jgi:hypothetical protein